MKKVVAAATNVGEVEVSAKSEFSLIDENMLKSRIYTIRGLKVMLDADLAEIYGYSTKAFNQQVKNNIEKFDEDFRFQLTELELVELRSKFLTANENVDIDEKLRCNLHRKYQHHESIKALCLHRAGDLHAHDGSQGRACYGSKQGSYPPF